MVTPYTGLIGPQCFNQFFMMLICPLMEKCNNFRTLLYLIWLQRRFLLSSTARSGIQICQTFSCCKSHAWQTEKTARLQNDKPQIMSTTVWTFKKFGYESDLKAKATVSFAVDKLSQELKIKWKDNTKASCSKFKALSVEERLNKVQKHKLCFCCLSPQHWFSNYSNEKQCGVNACTR